MGLYDLVTALALALWLSGSGLSLWLRLWLWACWVFASKRPSLEWEVGF
jgi:hypothetical protein